MKKRNLLILLLGMLCSCGVDSSSNTNSLISENSSLSSEVSVETSNLNEVDYSLFDKAIVGTWYVHQSANGLASINDVIVIKDDYTASFLGLNFSFIGLYADFEGACLFESPKKTVNFIASYDGEGNLDWAIQDIEGNVDLGYASLKEHVSGIQYSYEGTQWPIDQINEYLSLNISLPVYQHDYYYLYTGISQLKDQAYCMIDLYGVSKKARENYTAILEEEGYTFSKDDPTFYTGCNDEKIIAIRLKQYEDNLCIFIYYYSAFYAE